MPSVLTTTKWFRSHRLAVRTLPSQGGNRGSSPRGSAIFSKQGFTPPDLVIKAKCKPDLPVTAEKRYHYAMEIALENRPSLLRRMAAILYDGMLLIALWMAASGLWIGLQGGQATAAGDGLFRVYLLAVAYAFFVGFWVIGGRTLGMQAWRLELIDVAGQRVGTRAATHRFVTSLLSWALLGAGFFWALIDREGLTWHDRLSKTRLYLAPKPTRG